MVSLYNQYIHSFISLLTSAVTAVLRDWSWKIFCPALARLTCPFSLRSWRNCCCFRFCTLLCHSATVLAPSQSEPVLPLVHLLLQSPVIAFAPAQSPASRSHCLFASFIDILACGACLLSPGLQRIDLCSHSCTHRGHPFSICPGGLLRFD